LRCSSTGSCHASAHTRRQRARRSPTINHHKHNHLPSLSISCVLRLTQPILIDRIGLHRNDEAYCCRQTAWRGLCVSVCVFVSTVSPAKAAEPIEMFLGADLLGPEEPYKTGPDPPQEMTLEGTLDESKKRTLFRILVSRQK